MHSHSQCCNIVTSLFEGQKEFRISHQEMIKGIDGHGYFDELVIPIIENTAWESELADSLGEAIASYPKSCAVLVRRHGMYVWGKTWEQAKRHGECLHYLFEIAITMHKLGMDFNSPPAAVGGEASSLRKKRRLDGAKPSSSPSPLPFKHLLLDIEGTTTPLSFVKETLFPYASREVRAHLERHWSSAATQEVVKELLRAAAEDHSHSHSANGNGNGNGHGWSAAHHAEVELGLVPDPALLSAVTAYVQELIALDRKLGPLKTLQGHIWAEGYAAGHLIGQVYPDVAAFLRSARVGEGEVGVSIYSSGSREAQRLLFGSSNHGDLLPCLSSFFDTSSGPKTHAASYRSIATALPGQVKGPHEVLFVTDMVAEAIAAAAAGMQVRVCVRPGNIALEEQLKSLPEPAKGNVAALHTIASFDEIETLLQ